LIGRILDEKYEIVRSIGAGGMGGVYEAVDIGNGKIVAVKVIHASLASDDDTALLTRFEREARTAGSLDSRHIARVMDAGVDRESYLPFMVMEYLAGEDTQKLFGRLGVVNPDLALRIAAQACMGLSKAHEARIVHRDIKPANLFLAEEQGSERVVKLLDFGVAKITRRSDSMPNDGLTQTGAILGSPLYMSPEQARSARLVDHRSDLWSLGVVLYRALTGRTPYQHVRGLGELVLALCSDLPPLVQYFAPWVSPEITAIVDRALRIDPNQRFQSAEEMIEAIRPLLSGGFAIDAAMLEPLSTAARAATAPLFVRQAQAGPIVPLALSAPLAMEADADAMDVNAVRAPVSNSTQTALGLGGDMTISDAAPPRAHGILTAPTALIVLLSLALGGLGVYAFTRSSSGASGAPSPSAASASVVTPSTSASAMDPRSATPPVTTASFTGPSPRSPASRASSMPGPAERARPLDAAKPKEPHRLDHTTFGDRK
jgi:serine/threonine-protein kinase